LVNLARSADGYIEKHDAAKIEDRKSQIEVEKPKPPNRGAPASNISENFRFLPVSPYAEA
jgi:hypothetical protein